MREEPEGLLGRRFEREIGTAEERAGHRQTVADVVRIAARDRPQRAAIVVAEMRQTASVGREDPGGEGQPRRRAFEIRRRSVAGDARDGEREQVEIERVLVIVRRTLAMAAVGADLPVDLGDENLAPERRAAPARGELRERTSGDIQRQGLAQCVFGLK